MSEHAPQPRHQPEQRHAKYRSIETSRQLLGPYMACTKLGGGGVVDSGSTSASFSYSDNGDSEGHAFIRPTPTATDATKIANSVPIKDRPCRDREAARSDGPISACWPSPALRLLVRDPRGAPPPCSLWRELVSSADPSSSWRRVFFI